MEVFQKIISLQPRTRGFHIITSEILKNFPELSSFKTGLLHLFIQHTSASLTINENADPDVRVDFENHCTRLMPEDFSLYKHSAEGADDMTSHLKASLLGNSLTIPVTNGRLSLGTWQGIYLGEHRDYGGSRRIVLTFFGERSIS
ncbi:MAG TPA: secondary thiamine-phosphate synthase enzyme YjbQ [Patescibacteria group bacterium]|nr:secondary thiamine-phosphate synthase enzyme YjbQ [Patescibacteria group bacterium]